MADFTKHDIYPGYLVRVRNGKLGVIINTISDTDWQILLDNGGFIRSDEYNDRLENTKFNGPFSSRGWDIIQVYGYGSQTGCGFRDIFSLTHNERTLLWEREEVKEMTVAEIEARLGHKVKIIKG